MLGCNVPAAEPLNFRKLSVCNKVPGQNCKDGDSDPEKHESVTFGILL